MAPFAHHECSSSSLALFGAECFIFGSAQTGQLVFYRVYGECDLVMVGGCAMPAVIHG